MIKLRIFAISNSSINGNLPDSWSNITGLQTFMAVSSQLTGTVPQSWFGTMKSLTRFQVWDNNMDGPIPVT